MKTEGSVFGVEGVLCHAQAQSYQAPSYRLHEQSGQAILTLNGRDVLIGKFDTASSKAEYRRVTAEWMATKGVPRTGTGDDLTVSELVLAYWRHVKTYYRKDGKPTSERFVYRMVLKHVRQLYGPTRAVDFGPRALEGVMQEMVRLGWLRSSINKHAIRIRRMFAWAVENELLPAAVSNPGGQAVSVLAALKAVKGLLKGSHGGEGVGARATGAGRSHRRRTFPRLEAGAGVGHAPTAHRHEARRGVRDARLPATKPRSGLA